MSSLRTRLLLAVGLLAVTALAAVAFGVRQGARREFTSFLERRTASGIDDAAPRLAAELDGRCCSAVVLGEAGATLPADAALLVTGTTDGGLIASAGAPLTGVDRLTTSRDGPVLTIDYVRRGEGAVERIGLKLMRDPLPIRLADGGDASVYVVPFPNPERDRREAAFLGSLDRRLLIATTLVAMLALAATWAIARSVTRPIDELRAATRELAAGQLHTRVEPRGGAEVAELARAFNAMAEDLERQQMLRQGLVHDVAHELRTPLTALQCRLETVLDGLAPDPREALRHLREEVLHLGRLVDDLQELALAEARELGLDLQRVGVASVVASAVRAAGLDHDQRVAVEVPVDHYVRADATRLRQVLLNLLTNADRHTPPGGSIRVRSAVRDGEVTIDVANSGSRLDPDQLPRVFDRFYRTDPARQRGTGGTGLGLAIVKHLVEAQGGRVAASSGDDGVVFSVALPVA